MRMPENVVRLSNILWPEGPRFVGALFG